MKVVILGGSPYHRGGVEAFCDRASHALALHSDIQASKCPTNSAYFRPSRIPGILHSIASLMRLRADRHRIVWLQYVNLIDLFYIPIARLCGYRIVVTPHLGVNWRSQRMTALRLISRTLLRLSHRIALLSKTQQHEVDLPRGVPRRMIRTFLPAAAFETEGGTDPGAGDVIRLIHCARLSREKGTFHVVEVCHQLRQRGIAFQAEIVGGADEETIADLRRTIEEKELDASVHLVGRVPEAEVYRRLREADILLHLSTVDSLPLIVLEGIAAGTFPICLDLLGAQSIIEAYDGHLLGQEDPIRQAVAYILEADRSTLRARGRASAQSIRLDYGWRDCAAVLARNFRELAA